MSVAEIEYTKFLPDEDASTEFGAAVAGLLEQGDTILLSGPIGAGKSHLARAVIRSRLAKDEDIPSPTYTIVQTYLDTVGEIWHADLYRLGDSSELTEIGLDEALGVSLVLIEWPERLPEELTPKDALHLCINPAGNGREVRLIAHDARWTKLSGLFNAA